jgi:Cu(I)-responsive transcriptional regulator
MQHMNIGQAAAAAGVTPKMIRHYESLGLVPEAGRTDAGYRLYGERELSMLRFIRQSRTLGFSMQQIAELMSFWRDPDRRSQDVKDVARRQLEELQERQRELDQMRATLEQMVAQCRGDHGAHCVILDRLAAAAPRPQEERPAVPARRALKQVRAGEKRSTSRPARKRSEAAAPAHVGLSAWAQTFGRATAA